MTYTVVWTARAERHLLQLWVNAVDRGAVQRAADEVDRLLRLSPSSQGESREGDFRMMLIAPLGVKFRVIEAGRIVRVVRAWAY